ncbi:LysR family transcriptional regulator [Colwellia psychrerythraea]|uniref:Transcriptional regulator, LysR family n=1 Tax=Colwellia psychrerythraea TaxID=28229 RepID=A0A099KVH6_COLPS|nr:LysR family transcriptional regulator [Colwellia psychrerythraea]KGJ93872.1 transcriptional regulator, LysR family [Colwellia psychrerythraea]
MKQLDLNSLFVFITLYHAGSTQKAAVQLNRSQSYVSKVLSKLREELGDPLFVRTSSGLEPTSYASGIAPKVKQALAMMHSALEPESFDPLTIDKVTIHLAAPLIIPIGKTLITTIRQQTSAVIELREWHIHSESMMLEEQVDIAVHVLKDRPQSLYQKKIISLSGQFIGNRQGEFVKTIIDNFNEYSGMYQLIDADIQPGIIIDNQYLSSQLMGEHFTYALANDQEKKNTPTDVAFICKATRRNSAKVQWLMELCMPILKQSQW